MNELQQAVQFHQDGNFEEARKLYTQLLLSHPNSAELLNLLGVLSFQEDKSEEAEKYLLQAVKINPAPDILYTLGLVYYGEQDFLNAAKCFEQALAAGEDAKLIEKTAFCFKQIDDFKNAIKYYSQLHKKDPQNLQFIRELAFLYKKDNDLQNAIIFYEKSIALDKKDHIACTNLGLIYEQLKDFQKAKDFYKKSLSIVQNHDAAHNFGILLRKEKNYKQSIEMLKQALKLEVDNSKTELSLGMSYLSARDFQNGFRHYCKKRPDIRAQYKNPWDGDSHNESTLLAFCDGGFGDYIMFSRYLSYAQSSFARIILKLPKELESLFKLNFPDIKIVTSHYDVEYDFSTSLIDLPYKLDMDFEHTPKAGGYFICDENLAYEYKKKYFNNHLRKIGLFWRGNQRVFKNRSIRLEELEFLFSMEGCAFYSFQKDDSDNQIGEFPNIFNLEVTLKDFSHTASALRNLDVLITIDSAIAHLAGAMGVKTFLLLPYANEWRWFDDSKTTIWYESVELFRQKEADDWSEVVAEVFERLSSL